MHQNKDGGWPLIPDGKSDVENTALAIWALTDAGWGTGSRVIRNGVRYLRNEQREDGSWNNDTAHTTLLHLSPYGKCKKQIRMYDLKGYSGL